MKRASHDDLRQTHERIASLEGQLRELDSPVIAHTPAWSWTLLGLVLPWASRLPDAATITTAPIWDASIKWITIHYFDYIEAVRVWLLIHILNPIKAFLLSLPWLSVLLLLFAAGLRLGGLRLGFLVLALTLLIAVVGLWEKTIITVYLCRDILLGILKHQETSAPTNPVIFTP